MEEYIRFAGLGMQSVYSEKVDRAELVEKVVEKYGWKKRAIYGSQYLTLQIVNFVIA